MNYLQPYVGISLIFVCVVGFAVVSIILGSLIGPKRMNPSKMLAYESGMEPSGEANIRIPIKFYMVGVLFVLFDMETIYVVLWALVFQGNAIDFDSGQYGFTQQAFQMFAFGEMLVFIAILMVGYAYVWRKGGFEWS